MRKLIALVLLTICVLDLIGCSHNPKKAVAAQIDENVTKIDITHYCGGGKTEWSVEGKEIDSLREWLNKLDYILVKMDEETSPGNCNGGQAYCFALTGGSWPDFSYFNNGPDRCYILYEDNWFHVTNPSDPPVS